MQYISVYALNFLYAKPERSPADVRRVRSFRRVSVIEDATFLYHILYLATEISLARERGAGRGG